MNRSPQIFIRRRTVLFLALVEAGLIGAASQTFAAAQLVVGNATGLYSVEVARIAAPISAADVAVLLRSWPGEVAVGGGRYSMGGQVAVKNGLHLDMRQMNSLVWLRVAERAVRVQAGMCWRDLQDHLDPSGLAVKTMQSYSNFSVGGSVSVNVHGRYVGHGCLGHTVRALQLVLADGSIIESSRTSNAELFRAAIGGYGAVAVITEVELDLAENVRMERAVETVALTSYVEYFKAQVLANPLAVLHNADLLPPMFDVPVSVTWFRTSQDTALTQPERLCARGRSYRFEQNVIWALTELPGGQGLRKSVLHPLMTNKPAVKWLNHEASLDVAELEPRTRAMSTYVLQEYFIPERHFLLFARAMTQVLRAHGVEALNVSIRHSPADQISLVPWAREAVFSFVLYYKQRTWKSAQEEVGRWTRKLIDAALMHEGRFYLPYQLQATQAQFDAAYPESLELRRVKARVDPASKFSNELWRKYL